MCLREREYRWIVQIVSNLSFLKTEIINTTQYQTNRSIVKPLLHCAELFIIALELSSFLFFFLPQKLHSLKLNLLQGMAVGEFSACVSHLVFDFRKSRTCILRRAHTHSQLHTCICRRPSALLLCEDARPYFVGSGHYFEIHEVEWRNRVRLKFGAPRRDDEVARLK